MCTAISFLTKDHYFGRNLDLEYSYHETVTVTPRNYPFRFRNGKQLQHHYAIIGMATIVADYPLYYEATNEKGLSLAGLNFPGNAVYMDRAEQGRIGISPFELIPWVLGQCGSVEEAESLLARTSVVSIPFSRAYPLTPLHWHVADETRSLVVEVVEKGVTVYDNPWGVLTNNPRFPCQCANFARYSSMSAEQPNCPPEVGEGNLSLGLGAVGLPGDYSSTSRFVKAAFLRANVQPEEKSDHQVATVFDVMGAVAPPRGVVYNNERKPHYTTYTCCMDTARGMYFCRRHGELQPSAYSFSALDAAQLEICEEILDRKSQV